MENAAFTCIAYKSGCSKNEITLPWFPGRSEVFDGQILVSVDEEHEKRLTPPIHLNKSHLAWPLLARICRLSSIPNKNIQKFFPHTDANLQLSLPRIQMWLSNWSRMKSSLHGRWGKQKLSCHSRWLVNITTMIRVTEKGRGFQIKLWSTSVATCNWSGWSE